MKTFSLRSKGKFWQYLFWLGPLLIVAGVSARLVMNSWSSVALGLLVAGAVLVVLWLIWQAGVRGFWGRRSTQASTNALLTTLAVLVILGVINFLAVSKPARIDLTETQLLSLSPQSQQVLTSLKQPVKVLVFEAQPTAANRLLLEQYKRKSNSQFSFEFIDPQAQPGLAEKYQVQTLGDTFVESGQRRQRLEGGLSEVNLTPAIERIVSNRQSTAYFTKGHGEMPLEGGQGSLSQAVAALKQKNITPEPLNLLTIGEIPTDTGVIIIAGPKQAFLPAEVKLLEGYLNQGGSLFLMLDPQTKTGLEPLLNAWGVELDNRLVVDASGAGQMIGLGPAVAVINQYGDHPITRNFNQGFSLFPLAQALNLKPKGGEQVTDLLQTTSDSWAEADVQNQNLQFDTDRDRRGPLSVGVAISRPVAKTDPKADPKTAKQSRMVVIGDSEFAGDGLFNQGLNGDVFLNSVSWLSDRTDQTLSIRPKEPTNRRLQLTEAQGRWIGIFSLGLLPFGAFLGAFGLWWRRR